MSPHAHEPKVAALLALRDGLLSEAGEQRLRRHLQTCELCQQTLRTMATYEALSALSRNAPVPEVDYDRMALPLRRAIAEATREAASNATPAATGGRGIRIGVALAAAAALLLGLRALLSPAPPEDAPVAEPTVAPSTRPVVQMPVPSAVATVALGDVRAADAPLETLHDGLAEGTRLQTDAGGELHVRLSQDTGFVLGGDSALVLERLRPNDIRLRLERGAVTSRVSKRAPGAAYAVLHGPYAVNVHGTHFRVRAGAPPTVELLEGSVSVTRDGAELSRMRAPATFPPAAGQPEATALPAPHGLSTGALVADLSLPSDPQVLAWRVGGLQLGTPDGERPVGALRMRHPPGDVELGARLRDGRWLTTSMELPASGLRLDGPALRAQLPEIALAEREARRPSRTIEPRQIAAAMGAGHRGFQRCYERALKLDASLRPSMSLAVRLGPSGRVRTARLDGDAPDTLQRCIRSVARRLRFPAPGGDGLEFVVPLKFRQRR